MTIPTPRRVIPVVLALGTATAPAAAQEPAPAAAQEPAPAAAQEPVPAAAREPAPAAAQEPVPELAVGITGTLGAGVAPERHPIAQLRRPEVRRLVFSAVHGPLAAGEMAARLEGSGLAAADLVASGLFREQGGRFFIDFSLFTADDMARVSEVGRRFGEDLAAAVLTRRHELDPLIRAMTAPGVPVEATAYIVMGCFMLDWLPGPMAFELGIAAEPRARADGSRYVVWALDRPAEELRGLYWGSHNDYGDDYVLTSFGDHHALPRTALPDLLRRARTVVRRLETDPAVQPALGDLAAADLAGTGRDAAAVMLALRDGPRTARELAGATALDDDRVARVLDLLEALEYLALETDGPADGPAEGSADGRAAARAARAEVPAAARADRAAARVPVLTAGDTAALLQVRRITEEVLRPWLEANHGPIRDRLQDLTALRHGVPYGELFIQVWHEVFGSANRALVEAGWFADPYDRAHPGFIPAVWHPALQDAVR